MGKITFTEQMEEIQTSIQHLNEDYTRMVERLARIEADISWLKWLSMAIVAGTIMTLLGIIATAMRAWFR